MVILECGVKEALVLILWIAIDDCTKAILGSANRTTIKHTIYIHEALLNQRQLSDIILIDHPEDGSLGDFVDLWILNINLLGGYKFSLYGDISY